MYRINKILSKEMWISLFLVIACNMLPYDGAGPLTADRYHYDLTFWLDEHIPFMPWTLQTWFIKSIN